MNVLLALAHSRREEGFTLIELLTVVVIIGVLAAIAIPVFSSQRGRAADAASISEARSTLTAMETYVAGLPGGVLTDADTATVGNQLPTDLAAQLVANGSTAKAGDTLSTVVSFGTNQYFVSTSNTSGKSTKCIAYWGGTEVATVNAACNLSATFTQKGSVGNLSALTNAVAISQTGVITLDAVTVTG